MLHLKQLYLLSSEVVRFKSIPFHQIFHDPAGNFIGAFSFPSAGTAITGHF